MGVAWRVFAFVTEHLHADGDRAEAVVRCRRGETDVDQIMTEWRKRGRRHRTGDLWSFPVLNGHGEVAHADLTRCIRGGSRDIGNSDRENRSGRRRDVQAVNAAVIRGGDHEICLLYT